jgi:phage replication O-like protein O
MSGVFATPNYTQVANLFIEKYMSVCSGAETKIFLAISRRTIGWHKNSDVISYAQLKILTGLSVNSLKTGIADLLEKGLIIQRKTKIGYAYDLAMIEDDKQEIDDRDPSQSSDEEHQEEENTGSSKNDRGVSKIDTAISKIDTAGVSKIDTTKEINKDTRYKDNIYIGQPSFFDSDFQKWWSEYPRHEKKKKAKELYFNLVKTGRIPPLDKHIEILSNWKKCKQWQNGFIPHPTTWLSGERWEDEIPSSPDEIRIKNILGAIA